jgi:hypothetical protein
MHVERVKGDYIEPEIFDLEDGSGCLFRFHEDDIDEDGPEYLAELFTDQAQRWAPRPPGAPLGPVVPVRVVWQTGLPSRFAIGVEDTPDSITYRVDPSLLSQRALDFLSRRLTCGSQYWQRVPEGYHDRDDCE